MSEMKPAIVMNAEGLKIFIEMIYKMGASGEAGGSGEFDSQEVSRLIESYNAASGENGGGERERISADRFAQVVMEILGQEGEASPKYLRQILHERYGIKITRGSIHSKLLRLCENYPVERRGHGQYALAEDKGVMEHEGASNDTGR